MEKFRSWYHKYVVICNQRYISYIETLQKNLEKERSVFEKMIDFRLRMNMTRSSEIDEKIERKDEYLAKIEENLVKASSIREEMDFKSTDLNADKIYARLKKHQKISKIEIDGGDLNIITKKLKVKGKNIGYFKFTYNPQTERLFIRNLEYVVDGIYDHWHIKVGEPCLAEWKPILWKYLDTFQIFLFIDALIHYLLLSNSNHAYKPFEEWIKLFEEKPKVEKQKISVQLLSSDQLAYTGVYQTVEVYDTDTSTGTGWSTTTSYSTTSTYGCWIASV